MTFKEARALENTFHIYHLGNTGRLDMNACPCNCVATVSILQMHKQHTRMHLTGGHLHIGDRIWIGSSRIKILEVR
jgi:hypothetical protein